MSNSKHAVWATPAPPVTTVLWDQIDWDRFAERFRPAGYTGDIHDDKAYMIWCAQRVVDRGREAREILQQARPEAGLLLAVREVAARLDEAIAAAGVCRESHRSAHYCELGTCFVCTVARLEKGKI